MLFWFGFWHEYEIHQKIQEQMLPCWYSYSSFPTLFLLFSREERPAAISSSGATGCQPCSQHSYPLPHWSSTWQAQHHTTSGHQSIAHIFVANVVNLCCDPGNLEPTTSRTTSQYIYIYIFMIIMYTYLISLILFHVLHTIEFNIIILTA